MNRSETAEVLSKISALREEGRSMALATIVSVRGSTYRRPGARLLVPEAGEAIGNLSGGCLEGEVEEVARDVMSERRARLELYDLTADDEVVWGWGLGCNGAIEVLVEPADRAAELADALRLAIEQERPVAVATALGSARSVEAGARVLLHAHGRHEGSFGDLAADEAVLSLLRDQLAEGETSIASVPVGDEELRVFVEVLRPPLRLLVCGAGHDAIPLVRHASRLGWKVVVVDDRDEFLDESRFPGAAGFVKSEPVKAAQTAGVDGRTHAVVMSHNYLRDRDYLKSFLDTDVAYVGMLGPRARLQRLLGDLAAEGIEPSEAELERLHGPAGLDVGAEGPEEIASAIVAEILAVSRGRGAGFLRDRSGPIHERRRRVAEPLEGTEAAQPAGRS